MKEIQRNPVGKQNILSREMDLLRIMTGVLKDDSHLIRVFFTDYYRIDI